MSATWFRDTGYEARVVGIRRLHLTRSYPDIRTTGSHSHRGEGGIL